MRISGHKSAGAEPIPVTLLFLDRYNAEDPLFVADVARRLNGAFRNGWRVLILHAADDAIERVLEREADPEENQGLVERAVMMANQSITRRLIDEGATAVSIQGNNKGLLRIDSDGTVTTGHTEWLERAILMGSIPVVSLLATTSDGRTAVADTKSVLEAFCGRLAGVWSITLVFFTTNRKSALSDAEGRRVESVQVEELSRFEGVPVEAGSAFDRTGIAEIVLTNSAGLSAAGLSGTRIL